MGLLVVAAAVGQFAIGYLARHLGYRFGERTSARLREQLTDRLMQLPARTVERAGTGDLASRATTDVALVAFVLRDAAPEVLFALVQAVIILVAVVLLSPLLGAVGVLGLVASRWCCAGTCVGPAPPTWPRAPPGPSWPRCCPPPRREPERSSCSACVRAGAPPACRPSRRPKARCGARCACARVLFPTIDVSSAVAVGAVFCVGGLLHLDHGVSLGTVVAATLYLRQLSSPIDTILVWVETLQSSLASFARIEGLAAGAGPAPPPARDRRRPSTSASCSPTSSTPTTTGTSSAGSTSTCGPVSTSPSSEHPGPARPPSAGSSPASTDPAPVRSPSVAPSSPTWPPSSCANTSSSSPRNTTSSPIPLRDNLTIAAPDATDDEVVGALHDVGAHWVDELPDRLDTDLGAHPLSGAQAQQVALARVLLANPHTLVLDEATALLDPRTARHTERALAATVRGRTVIAVAHRLHTARDADRVAVMDGGRITEIGAHHELAAAHGTYAALWQAWSGRAVDEEG